MSTVSAPSGTAPLAGVTVIEISAFVAAPLGGMTLSQLGADVIRIDPLGGAADIHRMPVADNGTSLYWTGLNKGKKSFCVDFRSEDGQRLIADLVAASGDNGGIVLTNAVGRRGLDYDALRVRRDDLIHLTVQGRSDGSAAVDYTINAGMGFPMVTGPAALDGPVNHVLPAWDITCGLYAALGIVVAERSRRNTGKGQGITVALEDVALAIAGNLGFLAEVQTTGAVRERIGNHLYGGFARDFRSADGVRIMLVALTSRHWRDLVQLTDSQAVVSALETAEGVDFTTESDRYSYREVLAAIFERWFTGRSFADIESALNRSSVMWSCYLTFEQLVRQGFDGNRTISRIDQPGVGLVDAPGSPLVMDGRVAPAVPAPVLGEHTDDLLSTMLGLSAERIGALHDAGVV